MTKAATLTPALVRHMSTNSTLCQEFPFIRFAKKSLETKSKSSCCGKKRRLMKGASQVVNTVAASIAHLPSDRVAIIKKELNVDTLVITVEMKGTKKTYTL